MLPAVLALAPARVEIPDTISELKAARGMCGFAVGFGGGGDAVALEGGLGDDVGTGVLGFVAAGGGADVGFAAGETCLDAAVAGVEVCVVGCTEAFLASNSRTCSKIFDVDELDLTET